MGRRIALLATCALLAAGATSSGRSADTASRSQAEERVYLLGRSHRGRPIHAVRTGTPSSRAKLLVVGCIHGNECAGIAVARRVVEIARDAASDVWVVPNLNPDGLALGVRQNARGVDLNRNFPSEWRPAGRRWDPQYSGPRPLSERESRIAHRLILRVRPDVTVWFHQPQDAVRAWGRSVPAARRYARLVRERFRAIRWPRGTAPNWQNHRFRGASAFVVELPARRLAARDVDRHASAVVRVGR